MYRFINLNVKNRIQCICGLNRITHSSEGVNCFGQLLTPPSSCVILFVLDSILGTWFYKQYNAKRTNTTIQLHKHYQFNGTITGLKQYRIICICYCKKTKTAKLTQYDVQLKINTGFSSSVHSCVISVSKDFWPHQIMCHWQYDVTVAVWCHVARSSVAKRTLIPTEVTVNSRCMHWTRSVLKG
jgi:hypothetical protein